MFVLSRDRLPQKRLGAAALSAGLLAAGLVGWASQGSSSAAVAHPASAGKSVIKIVSSTQVTGVTYSSPEYKTGMLAAVDAINAAGGIHGHMLSLSVCDNEDTVNGSLACARQMASSGAVAAVGPFFQADGTGEEFKILQDAKIPVIGDVGATTAEDNNPNDFPELVGAAAVAGEAQTAVQIGAKHIAILVDSSPYASTAVGLFKSTLKRDGVSATRTVTANATSDPTFSSAAAEATSGDVDCVVIFAVPPTGSSMIKALRQDGFNGKIVVPSVFFPQAAIEALGAPANGIDIVNPLEFINDKSNPGIAEYLRDMKKYFPHTQADDNSTQAWTAVELFAKIAATAKNYTPAGILAAVKAVKTPINLGTIGPWAVAGRIGKIPGLSQVVNPDVTYGVVRNDQIVSSGKFINPFAPLKK